MVRTRVKNRQRVASVHLGVRLTPTEHEMLVRVLAVERERILQSRASMPRKPTATTLIRAWIHRASQRGYEPVLLGYYAAQEAERKPERTAGTDRLPPATKMIARITIQKLDRREGGGHRIDVCVTTLNGLSVGNESVTEYSAQAVIQRVKTLVGQLGLVAGSRYEFLERTYRMEEEVSAAVKERRSEWE